MSGYVGIPTSYTPVEYIESSGTQWIDTGIYANNNTKVVAEISNFPPTGATWAGAFGARNSSLTDRYCFFKTNDNIYRSDFGSANESFPSGLDLTSRTIITKDKNVTTIGQYTVTGATATFTATYTMWIFAVHDQNGANAPTSLRLYSFKIYDNDTLVRDFVPVKDENNVACLYEQVEGKFYYNKGSGTFTAGSATGQPVSIGDKAREITKAYVGVPASYTPVEYIESSGTQYIDTGFKPNQDTNMQIDFQYLGQNSQVSSTTSICVAGVRQVVADNKLVFWVEKSTSKVALNYGTYDSGFVANTDCSQRTTLKNQGCSLLYNGTTVASSTSSNFTSTYNILLFGITSTDSTTDLRGIIMKLYSFKIWDNDTLVRDFIPVLDYNNVACLYEQVEGKFYYNQGSGTFTAGSVTGQPVSIGDKARKIVKGYVGVNGVARLCFQWKNKTPPNTFMLCHFDNNCYDEITEATIPTGFGVNYITGKFSQAAHRTNTNQTQFTNSRLPKLEDVFAGTADPFTITYWSNGSGEFWYKNLSPVYVSSRETSYLGIKVSQITNPSVGVVLCYYYTGSNSYARTTYVHSGVTSADYGGTFHHHAIEVMQTGIRFYFDGVLKCTVSHVDYKYNSNNIRYVHFQDIDELMICDGNIYGGTSFLPPQEPYVT